MAKDAIFELYNGKKVTFFKDGKIIMQDNKENGEDKIKLKKEDVFQLSSYFLNARICNKTPLISEILFRNPNIQAVYFDPNKQISISAGLSHALLIDGLGDNIYAWGLNTWGQLGCNTAKNISTPTKMNERFMPNEGRVKKVSVGLQHSLLINSQGDVYAWGDNYEGQLGDNSKKNRDTVVQVSLKKVANGKKISSVTAGYWHSLAIDVSGKIYGWGSNDSYQISDKTNPKSILFPVDISSETVMSSKNIISISAGCRHSLALDSSGAVYVWGQNNYAQIGNGEIGLYSPPTQVKGELDGKKIVFIKGRFNHSLALDFEGRVYSWGQNDSGQLGHTQENLITPTQIKGILAEKNIVSIDSGYSHTIALDSEGKVYSWGDNGWGQLGNGSFLNEDFPIQVEGVLTEENIVSISAGHNYSFAINSEGEVYTWGKILGSEEAPALNKIPTKIKTP